jgi:hypothetical protein
MTVAKRGVQDAGSVTELRVVGSVGHRGTCGICPSQGASPERLCVSVEWIAVRECCTWVWVGLTALGNV